jgi:hypothetical protein
VGVLHETPVPQVLMDAMVFSLHCAVLECTCVLMTREHGATLQPGWVRARGNISRADLAISPRIRVVLANNEVGAKSGRGSRLGRTGIGRLDIGIETGSSGCVSCGPLSGWRGRSRPRPRCLRSNVHPAFFTMAG